MRHLASLRIMVSAEQDQRARRVIGLAMFKIAPAFGQRQNSRDIPPRPADEKGREDADGRVQRRQPARRGKRYVEFFAHVQHQERPQHTRPNRAEQHPKEHEPELTGIARGNALKTIHDSF